jgi:hypothetical protein
VRDQQNLAEALSKLARMAQILPKPSTSCKPLGEAQRIVPVDVEDALS